MNNSDRRSHVLFRPISLVYFLILLVLFLMAFPLIFFVLRQVLVSDLGLPLEAISIFLIASLFGSFVNIPIMTLSSRVPMFAIEEASHFGVTWLIPRLETRTRTTISLNVGGALVPMLVSLYILFWSIPHTSLSPLLVYAKIFFVLLVVSIVVNRSSRLVKGLGIVTPALIPPITTALVTLVTYPLGVPSSPVQMAYVGGTLGTLIGADLMNLHNISRLGAPVVSIGGAGTFDGVYTTGLLSVLLVLLL